MSRDGRGIGRPLSRRVRCPVPARAGEELTAEVDHATPRHVGMTSAMQALWIDQWIHLGRVDDATAAFAGGAGADSDSLVARAVGAPPHGTTALAAPICRPRGAQPRARAVDPQGAHPHASCRAAAWAVVRSTVPARRDPRHLSPMHGCLPPAASRRLAWLTMQRRKQFPDDPSEFSVCLEIWNACICSLLQSSTVYS